MKKNSIILVFILLLCGCHTGVSSSINSASSSEVISQENSSYSSFSSEQIKSEESSVISSENTSISLISSSSSSSNKVSSSVISSNISSSVSSSSSLSEKTSSEVKKVYSIKEVVSLGENLKEGEQTSLITFSGMYVKAITDNMDKLMLFVDEESYINVRVVGGFNDFLKNRYLNCYYEVQGKVSKNNGNIEVNYSSLSNLTSKEEGYDYSHITLNKNSISEVYNEIRKVTLNNKDTGVGKIVTFDAIIVASDESDSNTKVVVYDESNVITVIDDKKICNKEDMGQKYTFTGIISVLKTSPSILLLDKKFIEKVDVNDLSYVSAEEVQPSYFSKWYYTSNKQSKPSLDVYSKLYKVTGYVIDDTSRTSKYYLGLVDQNNGTLNDNGITTSIKGIYLMNNLNLSERELTYSPFYDYYVEGSKVTFYASFYQFDSNNHGWKMFALNNTIEEGK